MRRLRLFAGGRPVSFASGKAEGDDETVPSSAAKGKATLVVETPKTADVIPGVQAEAPHEDQPSQSRQEETTPVRRWPIERGRGQ